MFYLAVVKDGVYSVMDTEDGVMENYSLAELENFKKLGIRFFKLSEVNKYVHFIWHFYMNSCEFGNDEFSNVIGFMEGKEKLHFGGSRYDYATSLKADYLEMLKMGFTFDLNNMFYSKDALISDLCKLYYDNQQDLDRTYTKQRCDRVASKWHLSKKEISYYFG